MLTLSKNPNISNENKIGLAISLLEPKEVRFIKGLSRNDDCICGSGKKFKKCHLSLFNQLRRWR